VLAAERILQGARGWGQNDFKLPLAKNAIVQALLTAARGTAYARGEREGEQA
jgi:xanthine dehydrogenase YagS FAD-binding subunit